MKRGRRKKQRKIIVSSAIGLLCIMSTGYAAFQTNLNINAKGNIKDIKKEVDAKVPINDLLFWGQVDNGDNTQLILKDKTNHNDGLMKNFNNNSSSGFNNGELIFDGIDDYVDIGYANYDFKNSISYVMYLKMNKLNYQALFGNWEGSGSGLVLNEGVFGIEAFDGTKWLYTTNTTTVNMETYYTVIATYNGSNFKVYVDGIATSILEINNNTVSPMAILIGANPNPTDVTRFSNISVKEVMLYDRALTEDEVKSITNGFELKYK